MVNREDNRTGLDAPLCISLASTLNWRPGLQEELNEYLLALHLLHLARTGQQLCPSKGTTGTTVRP